MSNDPTLKQKHILNRMVRSYTQLDIFGNKKERKIFHRHFNGQFASTEPTIQEKLMRENIQLKNKNEELERKVLALVKYQRILITNNNK